MAKLPITVRTHDIDFRALRIMVHRVKRSRSGTHPMQPDDCMVFINTLMLQQVLAQPHWTDQLMPRDQQAITPLIWDHANPYGRYELDIAGRIPILA